MKRINSAAAVWLLLLVAALPWGATAKKGGPSAEGSVRLSEGGRGETIEFSAAADEDGTETGRMKFTESAGVPTRGADVDGGPDLSGVRPGLSFNADFDCLAVVGNKAVMSGFVTDSTPAGYAGRRVVLVVLDNGEGENARPRDKLTWGVYRQNEKTWMASDAEMENDPGAGQTWIATDAEREDDAGKPSNEGEATTCKNLPLSSFSLIELKQGEGNIRVRQ